MFIVFSERQHRAPDNTIALNEINVTSSDVQPSTPLNDIPTTILHVPDNNSLSKRHKKITKFEFNRWGTVLIVTLCPYQSLYMLL